MSADDPAQDWGGSGEVEHFLAHAVALEREHRADVRRH